MTTNPKTLADLKPGDAAMTTTEKLHRIRARCIKLLEIASKRTPGRWPLVGGIHTMIYREHPEKDEMITHDDCRFIAACAGAAEAGWKNTIAAIDNALSQHQHAEAMRRFLKLNGQYWNDLSPHMLRIEKQAQELIESIIANSEELL